jgi:hypothetical protein
LVLSLKVVLAMKVLVLSLKVLVLVVWGWRLELPSSYNSQVGKRRLDKLL